MKIQGKKSLMTLLGFVVIVTLFLGGCANKQNSNTTTSKQNESVHKVKPVPKKVKLADKELAVAAYLENYIDQFGTKDIPSAIKSNLKQPEFNIIRSDKNKYQVDEAKELSANLMASEVEIDGDSISSKDFNGNQLKGTQKYTRDQLNQKYGAYQKKIDQLIKVNKNTEDKLEKLNNEELAMAAYVLNAAGTQAAFEETLDQINDDATEGACTFESNPFKIRVEPLGNIGTFEILQGQVVGDFTNGGSPDTQEVKYSVKELDTRYKQFKPKLDELIEKGKSTAASADDDDEDTDSEDEDVDSDSEDEDSDADVDDSENNEVPIPDDIMDKVVADIRTTRTQKVVDEADFKGQKTDEGIDVDVYTPVPTGLYKRLIRVYHFDSDNNFTVDDYGL
ncbi:hypothetical protein [Pediococcus acidilactici]|uniref:hypothetical protein n=1 Tax=Pediococcus acidilactici TaxID=1254 RepID=UPI00194DB12E|nr:hypothetical protein [Pediococcus acidilactici]MBM6585292.1 hypothetical protein [Pediococcus acidilactici]